MTCFPLLVIAAGPDKEVKGKPGKLVISALNLGAVVLSIDHNSRRVTLVGPKGNSYTLTAADDSTNLSQVNAGDKLKIQLVEAVNIQVYDGKEIDPGESQGTAAARAAAGEKPAGLIVDELTVVATITGIDMENELVTLENVEGKSHTVKVQKPENLKRISIGDRAKITYTEAVSLQVTK